MGVRLLDDREEAAVGAFVHAKDADWMITSNVEIGRPLLECDVLDRLLPGRLGAYFYPIDAVFHMPHLARGTRTSDLRKVIARETSRETGDGDDDVVHHMSVAADAEEGVVQEDEDEDDSEEEDDEDEDDEGEQPPVEEEEVWESGDES